MKENTTGFEALRAAGRPLKELTDKKGSSFSELKDLGPGFTTLKSITAKPGDSEKTRTT